MFLSRMITISRLGLFGFALLGALLVVGPASAQTHSSLPRIPPGTKGYQVALILMEHQRRLSQPTKVVLVPASPAARSTVATGSRFVSIRGPDGRVRVFEYEGNIPPRRIVVLQESR